MDADVVLVNTVVKLLAQKVIPALDAITVIPMLPAALPPLFEALKSSNADLRKSCVFLIVELYILVGDDLTPLLADLSASQVKLIGIYVQRARKERGLLE